MSENPLGSDREGSRHSRSASAAPSKSKNLGNDSMDPSKNSKRKRKPRDSSASTDAVDNASSSEDPQPSDFLSETRKQLEKERKKTRTLKDEIDTMGQQNIDELKKLREEIEMLKAEVSIDSAADVAEPRRMSESTTSTDSVSADMSFEEMQISKLRRVSDAGGANDSIISVSAKARRSKDDLDLLIKQKQKSSDKARPPKAHRGAVAVDNPARPPSLSSVRPATSVQLPRKPQMVRSGTTIDASIKSTKTPRHKRTLSDEDDSTQSSRPRKPKKSTPSKDGEKSIKDLVSSPADTPAEDGLALAGGSGLAGSAVELRKVGRLDEMSRSNSKAAKLLGSDDLKASKLLGIEVSRARLLDSPRSARSPSSADQANFPASPRERTSSSAQSLPPTPSFDIHDDIIFQRDTSGSATIKGATPDELVRQLIHTDPNVDQQIFTTAFLVTCNTFLTASDLLSKLINAFDAPDTSAAKRSRIVDVFDMWLDLRHRDFVEEKEMYLNFARFLEQQLKPESSAVAEKLIAKLEHQRSMSWQKAKRRLLTASEADAPTSPSSKELLSFKHRGIANELTMIVSDLFQTIDPLDLLTQHKRKPGLKEASKISLMISQFNLISNWAATEVVRQEQLPKRCKVLTQLMKVALDCFDLQNFDSATAITSGLQSAAVARLALTWGRVQEENSKVLQRYRSLEATLSSEDNYKVYRALQSNVKAPAIPFLGVFLKDVVFISDGNPDYLEADFGKKDFVNFDKRLKLSNIVVDAKRLQVVPYDFKRDIPFRRYLDNFEVLEDIELYNASLVAEARVKRARAKIADAGDSTPSSEQVPSTTN